LNLAEVRYIDSSGLGQLIVSYATVTNRGGQMKLLTPVPRDLRVLQNADVFAALSDYK
jgi:anti-anti-sigma factor